jgi:hypothetical protein
MGMEVEIKKAIKKKQKVAGIKRLFISGCKVR